MVLICKKETSIPLYTPDKVPSAQVHLGVVAYRCPASNTSSPLLVDAGSLMLSTALLPQHA
jgi:hypothetical protein